VHYPHCKLKQEKWKGDKRNYRGLNKFSYAISSGIS